MTAWFLRNVQFFSEGTNAYRLDGFRIFFALAAGVSFMSLPWEFYANIPQCSWEPQGTARFFLLSPPDLRMMVILKYIFIFSLLTLALGLFARISAFVAAISLYFLMGTSLSAFSYDRSGNTLLISLFVLFLSPGLGANFSLDRLLFNKKAVSSPDMIWPVRLIQFLFFFTFFAAGLSKLINSGWAWTEADNLIAKWQWAGQSFSANKLFAFQDVIHNFMVQQHWIAGYIGIFVVILELSSILFFLFQGIRPWGVILLALLQMGILFTMYISFNLFWPLYLIFIPSEKLIFLLQRRIAPSLY